MHPNSDFEQQLQNFVLELIKEKMSKEGKNFENIDDNFMLVSSGLFDSFSFLELLASIENKFNIEIDFSEKDPSEFLSFGGFVKSIASLTNKNE